MTIAAEIINNSMCARAKNNPGADVIHTENGVWRIGRYLTLLPLALGNQTTPFSSAHTRQKHRDGDPRLTRGRPTGTAVGLLTHQPS